LLYPAELWDHHDFNAVQRCKNPRKTKNLDYRHYRDLLGLPMLV